MWSLSLSRHLRFNALDLQSQVIVASLLEKRTEYSEKLRDQTLALAQLLSPDQGAIIDHLEECKMRFLGAVQEAQRTIGGEWPARQIEKTRKGHDREKSLLKDI